MQHLDNKENALVQEQQYCLAKNRMGKHIKPLQRYAYANLVACALSMAESIENKEPHTYHEAIKEPHTYHEAITSKESTQWIVAMNKEIESL